MKRCIIFSPRAIHWILRDSLLTHLGTHGSRLLSPVRKLAGLLRIRRAFLGLLMREHRYSRLAADRTRLQKMLALTSLVRAHLAEIHVRIDELRLSPPQVEIPNVIAARSIILSMPKMDHGVMKRGVLLITFTETFAFFMNHIDVEALLRSFRLVLEPSSSGYCLPEILFWTRYPDPILVMASDPIDREFLNALKTNLIPIPIGASDWTDYRIFRPVAGERVYDVIYVANLTWIKRVHVLLRALRSVARRGRSLKAVIVLSSWGANRKTKAAFEEMLDYYDVRSQVTVLWDLDRISLNEWICRTRVSILLSTKEGSNRTLFEAIFADTPVILLKNNVGVNKEYINEHTGRIISEEELPDVLVEFSVESSHRFAPRAWGMTHIAPEISAKKLELAFEAMDSRGVSFPLLAKVNSPEVTYMNPQEAKEYPPVIDVLRCFAIANGGQREREFVSASDR